MKVNIFSKILLITTVVLSFFVGTPTIWAQQNASNEVLVYVKPNTIKVPLEQESSIELTMESIKSQPFFNVLQRFQISQMKRAFANFNLADTLRYTKDGKPIAMLNLERLYKLTVPSQYERDSVIAALIKLPEVIYAEKNGGWKLHTNDPHYTKQWYLKNTGQSGGKLGADIKAEYAWQIFTGSSQIKIGIIDSGVKTDHEDLSGKVSGDNPDYNWHDPYWYYSYSHGTHVAGIASAKTNNGVGVAGVDQNAQIYSYRIFDSQNHQNDNTFIYNAIVDAVDQGCNVLNNSWGGTAYSTTIRYGFAYAYKMNRVVIASMDDHGATVPTYPANYGQGIIAVGATNDFDVLAPYSQAGSWIDVSAPGGASNGSPHDIFSTVAYYNSTYGGYYDYLAGTSMAAPVVTGIASLLKGYNPNLYNDDIEQIIRISTDDKGPTGWDQEYGTGRVNAYKALNLLRAPYQLTHASTYGGSYYANTGSYKITIYGASGLADGFYIVEAHEVRKNITFPHHTNPYVWGRGVGTVGWSLERPNFAMGFCDVIPGSVTNTSATLRTYVYKVWTLSEYLGYYPASPSNVNFNYTILGIPTPFSVSISGPSYLNQGQTGTWTANVTAGTSPYTYKWYYFPYCDEEPPPEPYIIDGSPTPLLPTCGQWFGPYQSGSQYSHSDYYNFDLKCVVTDANGKTASDIIFVKVSKILEKPNSDNELASIEKIPEKFSLNQNYPNPFNPSTIIHFELPEPSYVSLSVYDILGKEVAKLVDKELTEGYYDIQWYASNYPSGMYIYRISTDKYSEIKKMLLVK